MNLLKHGFQDISSAKAQPDMFKTLWDRVDVILWYKSPYVQSLSALASIVAAMFACHMLPGFRVGEVHNTSQSDTTRKRRMSQDRQCKSKSAPLAPLRLTVRPSNTSRRHLRHACATQQPKSIYKIYTYIRSVNI